MANGIPSQLRRFNERLEQVERSQLDLQRVVDAELLPAVRLATEKADAALLASKPSPKGRRQRPEK